MCVFGLQRDIECVIHLLWIRMKGCENGFLHWVPKDWCSTILCKLAFDISAICTRVISFYYRVWFRSVAFVWLSFCLEIRETLLLECGCFQMMFPGDRRIGDQRSLVGIRLGMSRSVELDFALLFSAYPQVSSEWFVWSLSRCFSPVWNSSGLLLMQSTVAMHFECILWL